MDYETLVDLSQDLLVITARFQEQLEDVADQIDLTTRSGARVSRSRARRALRDENLSRARLDRAARSGLRAVRVARSLRDEELRAELADRAARSLRDEELRADRAARSLRDEELRAELADRAA
ncbi:hypothetical protein I6F20_36975, partial [Bradyrhizobium sp. IC3123]